MVYGWLVGLIGICLCVVLYCDGRVWCCDCYLWCFVRFLSGGLGVARGFGRFDRSGF